MAGTVVIISAFGFCAIHKVNHHDYTAGQTVKMCTVNSLLFIFYYLSVILFRLVQDK